MATDDVRIRVLGLQEDVHVPRGQGAGLGRPCGGVGGAPEPGRTVRGCAPGRAAHGGQRGGRRDRETTVDSADDRKNTGRRGATALVPFPRLAVASATRGESPGVQRGGATTRG